MKQSPIARHWSLLQNLSKSDDGYSVDDLSKELHVSARTIHRDLSTMRDAGVALSERQDESTGKKYWQFLFPTSGKTIGLSYDEAVALYVGRQFLEPMMGSVLWEAVNSGLDKIRMSLGSRMMFYFERLSKDFLQTRIGWSDYRTKGKYLDDILLGIEESQSVKIQYRSQSASQSELYAIDPYHVLMHKGSIYIIGYSHKAQALRHWKFDRVESASIMSDKFVKDPEFSIGKYMEGSFGVIHFPTDKLQKVKIQFDESVARYVGEHRWSTSQKITQQPDGTVILDMELNNTVEVKSWILGFGPHAKVLRPAALRDEIIADLKAMMSQYE